MTQYDNTNKGALFVNDRKESDRHPDWKGSLNIDGVEYWISGWAKSTARGDVISLALGDQKQQTAPQRAPATSRPPARAPAPQRPQAAPAPAPRPSSGFDDSESDDCPF